VTAPETCGSLTARPAGLARRAGLGSQYPYWVDVVGVVDVAGGVDVVGVVGVVLAECTTTVEPLGVTTCQVPPKPEAPLPATTPELSLTNVYSGWPFSVS
jgi:hypothetical protein